MLSFKNLIWIYVILLFFEGASRKWFFPSVASFFYFVRDPIVFIIYLKALNKRIFPKNGFVIFCILYSLLFIFLNMFHENGSFLITLFGIRTSLLFIPLIFIIPKILNYKDIEKIGKVFLIFAVPQALLMLVQFMSPMDACINKGIQGAELLVAAYSDSIRPPGFFASASVSIRYIAITVAFALYFLT
jgi:hypothetical protein